jgi:hypothetical protein
MPFSTAGNFITVAQMSHRGIGHRGPVSSGLARL